MNLTSYHLPDAGHALVSPSSGTERLRVFYHKHSRGFVNMSVAHFFEEVHYCGKRTYRWMIRNKRRLGLNGERMLKGPCLERI